MTAHRSILQSGSYVHTPELRQQQAENQFDEIFDQPKRRDKMTVIGPGFDLSQLMKQAEPVVIDNTAADHLGVPNDQTREYWLEKLNEAVGDAGFSLGSRPVTAAELPEGMKLSVNPKDQFGIKKWRQFMTVPARVLWEVGVAMLEGAMKYGRHNYRVSGVQASIYTDAALGHIHQWIEGEDIDAESGLSHITKAITSLIVLRDGMLEGNFVDDRPPANKDMDAHRAFLQAKVEELFARYPQQAAPFLEVDR